METKYNFETFEECKNEISNIETLTALFDLWKNAHENEDNESCGSTFPKNLNNMPKFEDYKKSFCIDGYLSDKFNGILFILKESNTEGIAETEDTFWFKDCKNAKRWNLYHNSMVTYLEMFFGEKANYRECAYMNLNKRGGFGKCDDLQLKNYVDKYPDFIKKQIEIIKPKHIICCGSKTVFDLVLPIVKDSMTDITLYDCYHLCCPKRKRTRNIKL